MNLEKHMKIEKTGKYKSRQQPIRRFLKEAQESWEDAGKQTDLRVCRG